MSLRLSLKPRERVIIGGAVVKNGKSRAELTIENRVPLLRESDIMSPRSVRTPGDRVYFALQLAYVDLDKREEHLRSFRSLVADIVDAAPSFGPLIEPIEEHLQGGRYYQAIKIARTILDHERRLTSHVQ